MANLVVQVSYLVCAFAFVALGMLALLSRNRSRQFIWLVVGSVLTTLWSLSLWASHAHGAVLPSTIVVWLELARSMSWIIFLMVITGLSKRGGESWVKKGVGIGLALPLLTMIFVTSFDFRASVVLGQGDYFFLTGLARLGVAILGLFLLENLFRNADIDQRWATKYLCMGLGLIFAYDFFFYAEAVIFQRLDGGLFGARGFITALAAPLIAISVARAKYWTIDIHVSRTMVFHTAAVMGTGLYLLAISAAGFYVSQYGGDAGSIFQILFLALALILLVAIFASGSLRARARQFISDNFYSAKYDYREEWLRLIGTLSSSVERQSLSHRIVTAIAPIFECTAALIWVPDSQGERFEPEVSWNFGDEVDPLERDDPLIERLIADHAILEINESVEASLPKSVVRERPVWLIVPLFHQETLQGVLVLGEPRTNRVFGVEDRRLLETVAEQAGSYIAEARAAEALSRAQKMEEFSQRYTFIAHDMKNIVNQLAIMVQNAKQHGDNPAFQKDMIQTVSNSVERMKTMMNDLTAERDRAELSEFEKLETPIVDLEPSLKDFARKWQSASHVFGADLANCDCRVRASEEKLMTALNHIVQNAVEAVGKDGEISLYTQRRDGDVLIDISDTGSGMTKEFIQSIFFEPFKSTKKGGYGIGGFQIRQLVREIGGHLEIQSEPGQGTTVRIILPVLDPKSNVTPLSREARQ